MNFKCKACGGPCTERNGTYECQFCGSTFGVDDFAHSSTNQSFPLMKNADSGADVFDKNINGVLEIMAAGKKGSWSGSGYIISEKGFAITNAHVAADDDGKPCQKMIVMVCKQQISATVVALADDKAGHGSGVDLALIKLAKMPLSATALAFEDFANVRNGEKVYVIGNSLGDGSCITSGIVSDRRRTLNGKELLMTDCAINGGNSGGPIFNEKGLVIGTICSSRLKADGSETKGMNYAVPGDIVQQFIEQIQRHKGIKL